jgi:hypothetical protein
MAQFSMEASSGCGIELELYPTAAEKSEFTADLAGSTLTKINCLPGFSLFFWCFSLRFLSALLHFYPSNSSRFATIFPPPPNPKNFCFPVISRLWFSP